MTPTQIQFLRVRAEHTYAMSVRPILSRLDARQKTLERVRSHRIRYAESLDMIDYSETMTWWHTKRVEPPVRDGDPILFPEPTPTHHE